MRNTPVYPCNYQNNIVKLVCLKMACIQIFIKRMENINERNQIAGGLSFRAESV